MSTSKSQSSAHNASVDLGGRTPDQQKYLEQVAADAEQAVTDAEATIAALEASLKERRAEAARAREAVDGKDQG
jgi:hypothetical protein